MINVKGIVIIDDKGDVYKLVCDIFKKEREEYDIMRTTSAKEDISAGLEEIPSLIILNGDGLKRDLLKVCESIRKNPDNLITPMIVTASKKTDSDSTSLRVSSPKMAMFCGQSALFRLSERNANLLEHCRA